MKIWLRRKGWRNGAWLPQKKTMGENAYCKRQHTESKPWSTVLVPTQTITSNGLICSKRSRLDEKKKKKQQQKNPFNLKSGLDGIGLWRLWNPLHLWFLTAAYTNICQGWPSYPFPASEQGWTGWPFKVFFCPSPFFFFL